MRVSCIYSNVLFSKKGGLIIRSKELNNLTQKAYKKPEIYEETIEIEDICGVSNGGDYSSSEENSVSIFDLFPKN